MGAGQCQYKAGWYLKTFLSTNSSNRSLTHAATLCILSYTMSNKTPITEVLRRTIYESGIPFLTLEQANRSSSANR